jgi:hypothetical protein
MSDDELTDPQGQTAARRGADLVRRILADKGIAEVDGEWKNSRPVEERRRRDDDV